MQMKNPIYALLGLSFVLASPVAFSDSVVTTASVLEDFETVTIAPEATAVALEGASLVNTWIGDGFIISGATTDLDESTGRSPLFSGAASKVLSVEGTVVCRNETVVESTPVTPEASSASQIDFCVFVEESVDTMPSTDDLGAAQVALSTGGLLEDDSTMVKWLLYCNVGGTAQWVEVGTAKIGTWVRVNLALDYANGKCRVSVDGMPLVSNYGFKKADSSTAGGCWYSFAGAQVTEAKVNSLVFTGLAKVDDVIISQEELLTYKAYDDAKVAQTSTIGSQEVDFNYNDLALLGVREITGSTEAADNTGYTVAQKIAAGYDLNDGKKLQIVSMNVNKGNEDAQSAVVQIPVPTRWTPSYKLCMYNVSDTLLGEINNYAASLEPGFICFLLPESLKDAELPKVVKYRLVAE